MEDLRLRIKFWVFKKYAQSNTDNFQYQFILFISIFIFLCLIFLYFSMFFIFFRDVYKYSLFILISTLILMVVTTVISSSLFRIKKAGTILLIKRGKKCTISMEYTNFEKYNNKRVKQKFDRDIELILDSNYLEQLKIDRVFLKTHESLMKFVLRKIAIINNSACDATDIREAIKKGYHDINGKRIIIKAIKKKTSILMTTRAGFDSMHEKKAEILQERNHYNMTIPVELIVAQKS